MHKANLVSLSCQAKKQQHFYDYYSLNLHNCSCFFGINVTDKLWEANKFNGFERSVIQRLININSIYDVSTLTSTCNLVRQPRYISLPKNVQHQNTKTNLSRVKIKSSLCLRQKWEVGFVPAEVLSGGIGERNFKESIFSCRIRISVR